MGHAPRKASHSLHLLRLAELLLEKLPLADVLGYHKTDTLPRVIQFVANNLNLDNFSVLFPVLRIAVKTPCTTPLLQFFEVSLLFFFGTNVKDGHATEFFVGISVLVNGCIVHFEEAQCFRIQHPSGKRIVAEEQTEHFFISAKSFFGAPPLDRQSDVASNGAKKLQIAQVVSIFVFVVLNYEHSDRGRGGLERNAQPCGRRRTDQFNLSKRHKPVELALWNQHWRACAENIGGAAAAYLLWWRDDVNLVDKKRK